MTKEESMRQQQIDAGGGASVVGDVGTSGGDFVGRDKIIISGQITSPQELVLEVSFRYRQLENVDTADLIGVHQLNNILKGESGGSKKFRGESTEYLTYALTDFSDEYRGLEIVLDYLGELTGASDRADPLAYGRKDHMETNLTVSFEYLNRIQELHRRLKIEIQRIKHSLKG